MPQTQREVGQELGSEKDVCLVFIENKSVPIWTFALKGTLNQDTLSLNPTLIYLEIRI